MMKKESINEKYADLFENELNIIGATGLLD